MPNCMKTACPSLKKNQNVQQTKPVFFSYLRFIYSWSSSAAVRCCVWEQCDHGMQIPCEWLVEPGTLKCCLGAEEARSLRIKRCVCTSQGESTPSISASRLRGKSSTVTWRIGIGTSYPSNHQRQDHRCGIIPLSYWLPGCWLQVHYFGSNRLVVERQQLKDSTCVLIWDISTKFL